MLTSLKNNLVAVWQCLPEGDRGRTTGLLVRRRMGQADAIYGMARRHYTDRVRPPAVAEEAEI
jgi:hypothetical protein